MNWKTLLANGLITLFVTALAGIITFFATFDRAPRNPMTHSVANSGSFQGREGNFSLVTVVFRNTGERSLEDFEARIAPATQNSITDYNVISRIIPRQDLELSLNNDGRIIVRSNVFVPNEEISVFIQITGANVSTPTVFSRTKSYVSSEIITPQPQNRPKRDLSIVILIIVLSLILQMMLFRYSHVIRRIIPGFLSRNTNGSPQDSAFVLLHSGFTDEAEIIFKDYLARHSGGPLTLSNHALAIGLQGDTKAGLRQVEGALWWAAGKHERAVVLFNRSLLYAIEGNDGPAEADLRKSIELSPNHIHSYLQFSYITKHYYSKLTECKRIMDNSFVNKKINSIR